MRRRYRYYCGSYDLRACSWNSFRCKEEKEKLNRINDRATLLFGRVALELVNRADFSVSEESALKLFDAEYLCLAVTEHVSYYLSNVVIKKNDIGFFCLICSVLTEHSAVILNVDVFAHYRAALR